MSLSFFFLEFFFLEFFSFFSFAQPLLSLLLSSSPPPPPPPPTTTTWKKGDRPYLVSGADDRTAKVWDYQTKACVHTLEGHAHNVSAVAFHPELPLIVTGSEDGAARLWHAATYRLEASLSYGLERLWAVGAARGSTAIALGYDDGVVLVSAGRDDPVASMDSGGKAVWARQADVCGAALRSLGAAELEAAEDGERLPLAAKELGSCDCYPQQLTHSPNGRFVAAAGDGEYSIYTALAWRSKAYGPGLDLAWADDSASFAVRESPALIRVHRQFRDAGALRPPEAAEGVHGAGPLLGVRCAESVLFYDWELVTSFGGNGGAEGVVPVGPSARLDVAARDVRWSESRRLVAVTTDSAFYILRYDAEAAAAAAQRAADRAGLEEEEYEEDENEPEVFELLHEVPDAALTCVWVGDAFVFANGARKLCVCVGGDVTTLAHWDRPQLLLGAVAGATAAGGGGGGATSSSSGRVYAIDRAHGIAGYSLQLPVIEYKSLVLAGDMEGAAAALPAVPQASRDDVARFLEKRGMRDLAAEVAIDAEYRFELAVSRGDLAGARELLQLPAVPASSAGGAKGGLALAGSGSGGNESRWRALGDAALAAGDLSLAAACLRAAGDAGGLLLLAASVGDVETLRELAEGGVIGSKKAGGGAAASSHGKANVAFAAALLLGDAATAVDVLAAAGRAPEAALFARSHAPSKVGPALRAWKQGLSKVNPRAAEALADPGEYPNLFPGWAEALAAEEEAEEARRQGGGARASASAAAAAKRPPSANGHAAASAAAAPAAVAAAAVAPPPPPPPAPPAPVAAAPSPPKPAAVAPPPVAAAAPPPPPPPAPVAPPAPAAPLAPKPESEDEDAFAEPAAAAPAATAKDEGELDLDEFDDVEEEEEQEEEAVAPSPPPAPKAASPPPPPPLAAAPAAPSPPPAPKPAAAPAPVAAAAPPPPPPPPALPAATVATEEEDEDDWGV